VFSIIGFALASLLTAAIGVPTVHADTPTCFQGSFGLSCQNYDGTQLCSTLGVPCNTAPSAGACASSFSVYCKSPNTSSSSGAASCVPTFSNLCLGGGGQSESWYTESLEVTSIANLFGKLDMSFPRKRLK
jgi:hypothetical protein